MPVKISYFLLKCHKMSSDSDTSEDGVSQPNDSHIDIVSNAIREAAKNVALNLLPDKSKQIYTASYNLFKKWCRENGTNSFCEDVLLAYFAHLSKNYAPTSLWSTYSMLKTTISTYNNINISNYNKFLCYLKRLSAQYHPKKALVFTKENISKFLNEAPDDIYLSTKVALIFGIAGALRRQEFVNIKFSDVKVQEDLLYIQIPNTKNNVPRSFTVIGGLYDICYKYLQARPQKCNTDRYFLKYFKGKCENSPIGINKFVAMPKEVALYLNLPDANKYTGHSFRRTSSTLLVDAGADITTLKRHGGWKSSTVAEGYVADSLNNKKRICKQISTGITIKKARLENVAPNNQEISHRTQQIQAQVTLRSSLNEQDISSSKHAQLNVPKTANVTTLLSNNDNALHESESNALIYGVQNIATLPEAESNKSKSEVLYHPDIGVYLLNENSNTLVFNNCKVVVDESLHQVIVDSSLYKSLIFNNCDVKLKLKEK